MAGRPDLQTLLEGLLGSHEVYYQPPESVKMKYPAIRYARKTIENRFANNSVYKQNHAYTLTAIYTDSDSDLPIKLANLPMCRFDRHYVADNLYHDVFTLYF